MNKPLSSANAGRGRLWGAFVLSTSLGCIPLWGSFQLVDDFEGGDLSAWTVVQDPAPSTAVDQFTLEADPADANNMVGVATPRAESSDAWIDRSLPGIAVGDTGTVFFRLRREDGAMTTGVGLTDMQDGFVTGGWGSFEPYVIMWNNADARVLEARNGDSGNANISNEAFADAWYKVWLVVDNDTNTYDVYVQGGVWVEQTLLADDFGFRGVADPAGDLNKLLIKCGGAADFSGSILLDDIYVDTKEANLSDPLANFQLVDDFESGDLSAWTVTMTEGATGEPLTTFDDPSGAANAVGVFTPPTAGSDDAWIDRAIPAIPDGGLGTIFFRLYRDDGEMTQGVGLTDLEDGYLTTGWGSFEPYLILYNNADSRVLEARNGDSGNTNVSNTVGSGTWFKIWMVVNNATDTYDVYIKGGPWAKQTLLADDFGFRGVADPAGDLTKLLVKAWIGSDSANPLSASIYLDDIYVDTETANLSDPVAAFTLVDDFQSADLTAWTVDGEDGQLTVGSDPSGGGANLVGVVTPDANATGGDAWISRSLPPIVEGSDGTLFFRMYREDDPMSNGVGLTDLTSGFRTDGWNGYESYMILYNNGENRVIEFREGSVGNTPVATQAAAGEWYKVWIVVDNEAETSSLYIQGGPWENQTLLAKDFGFRPGISGDLAGDLETFLIKNNYQTDSTSRIFIDDIYIDTESANLADPVGSTSAMGTYVGFAPTATAPTLDGTKDGSYRGTFEIAGWAPNAPVGDGPEDLGGSFSGVYTDDGLYLFISVIDDVFTRDSGADFWLDDGLQIFIDGDYNRGGSFDGENDVVFNVIPESDGSVAIELSGFPTPPSAADTTGLDAAMMMTTGGYDVEVYIPWAAINIMPVDSWLMGLDIAINEDDDGGDRDTYLALSAYAGGNNATNQYATAELWAQKTAFVPMTTETITIDGTKDTAFESAPVNHAQGRPGDSPASNPEESSFDWQMIYDSSFLYLFFEVKDSAMPIDSPTETWKDDGIEFVLDPYDTNTGAYNGAGDSIAKITFVPQADGSVLVSAAENWPPPPAAADFTGLEAAYVMTADGWALEAKIPLTAYQNSASTPFVPTAGMVAGADVMLNDDDDGGEGDGNVSWSAAAGVNFNTQLWGNVVFAPAIQSALIAQAGDTAIQVDGEMDDAYMDAPWNLVRRTDGNAVAPSPNDASVLWAGVYDDTNLYLLLDVIDDVLMVDSGDEPWLDDGLEVGFDVNNTNAVTFKLVVLPQLDGSVTVEVGGFPTPNVGDDTGLTAEMVMTDVGYQIELAVPFALMQIDPTGGHTLGLEIVMNDDDDGGDRDSTINWSTISGINFAAAQYGDALLEPDLFGDTIGATPGENGEYTSDWFGTFTAMATWNGWILHGDMGWLYSGYVTSADLMWIWSLDLNNWFYSNQSAFPWIFVLGDGWNYFAVIDGVPSLYNYSQGTWSPVAGGAE